MATKIQVRRDTSANWTSANPTLFSGEIGFETNTGKFKIGNGSTVWSSLDYFLDSSDLSAYLTTSSASTTYQAKVANVDDTEIGYLNISGIAGGTTHDFVAENDFGAVVNDRESFLVDNSSVDI